MHGEGAVCGGLMQPLVYRELDRLYGEAWGKAARAAHEMDRRYREEDRVGNCGNGRHRVVDLYAAADAPAAAADAPEPLSVRPDCMSDANEPTEAERKRGIAVKNACACRICGAPADLTQARFYVCQAHPGHVGDTVVGLFSDCTYNPDEG